jgi:PIN domain nuclease of toxin-antitoxin system
MRLLLDTCTFLRLISDYERIPTATIARLENGDLTVSVLCLWEILIKQGKGLLRIDSDGTPTSLFWRRSCETLNIQILPVTMHDIAHLESLPGIHRDPFDRLLICQAIEHGLAIVTPDGHIRQYPVKTLWD